MPLWTWPAWQAWRWTALAAALLRGERPFLPQALRLPAGEVAAIGDRRLLFRLAGTRRLRWLAGRQLGGDWDGTATPVEEHPAYGSFHYRFLGGAAWAETAYWQEIVRDVRHGAPRIGCRSLDDVERKFQSFDRLWQVTGTPAYRPVGGLWTYRPWEEVLVGRGRGGRLVLIDGRHRLIIGHLKACTLPMLLVLHHRDESPRSAPG